MKITAIASVIAPKAKYKIIGIRPGEKLHEQMISAEDAHYTYEYSDYYKILPKINNWNKDTKRIKKGVKVSEDFTYTSENNQEWMTKAKFKRWFELNKKKIGMF